MLEKIKSWFKKDKQSDDEKPCKYKKRGILDYLSKGVYIVIGLIVIYNLTNIYNLKELFITGDHIGTVVISGTISSEDQANANLLGAALKDAFEEDKSKAVVMIIRSGGGSPYESEKLVREINYLKSKHQDKKLYAVVEAIGASAAYHIASTADEIILGETSMIGSIGVILSNYDVRELIQKIGIKDRTITAGENKALLSYTKELTKDQEMHVTRMLDQVHQKFINDVKEGRKGKIKTTPEMFSGLVWVGNEAIELGVADRIGDLSTLKRELKIETVKNYTRSNKGLSALMGATMENMGQSFGRGLTSELRQQETLKLN